MLRTPKVHAAQAKRFRQGFLVSSSPVGGRLAGFLGAPYLQTLDALFVGGQNFNVETAKTQVRSPGRGTLPLCAITRPAIVVKSSASISMSNRRSIFPISVLPSTS